jgi:hypothetical protein
MLVSVAGLGDVQPAALAAKYAKTEKDMRAKARMNNGVRVSIYSEDQIAAAVDAEKRKDAAAPNRGFTQDFSFKTGDEPLIDAMIADKWEAAGICVAIQESKKAA